MSTYTDDFNRANSNDIGPPFGPPWVESEGDAAVLAIVSNRLRANGFVGGFARPGLAYYDNVFSDDQFSELTFKAIGGGTNARSGVAVRIAPGSTYSSFTGYTVEYEQLNLKFHIRKFSAQSLPTNGTLLGSTTGSITLADGDVCRAEAEGSTIRVVRNGATILSVTDSDLASGKAGVVVFGTASTSGIDWDDWEGGSIEERPLVLLSLVPATSDEQVGDFAYSDGFDRAQSNSMGLDWIESEDPGDVDTLKIHDVGGGNGQLWVTSKDTATGHIRQALAYWNRAASDRQYSQLTAISLFATAAGICGPAVRISRQSNLTKFTGYVAFFDSVQGRIELQKYLAQSLGSDGTILGTYDYVMVGDDALRIEADGTTIAARLNGNVVISVTDASTVGGKPGLATRGLPWDSSLGEMRWEQWVSGTLETEYSEIPSFAFAVLPSGQTKAVLVSSPSWTATFHVSRGADQFADTPLVVLVLPIGVLDARGWSERPVVAASLVPSVLATHGPTEAPRVVAVLSPSQYPDSSIVGPDEAAPDWRWNSEILVDSPVDIPAGWTWRAAITDFKVVSPRRNPQRVPVGRGMELN